MNWAVPFRPHGAVEHELRWGWGLIPILQLGCQKALSTDEVFELHKNLAEGVHFLLEEPMCDGPSQEFARFSLGLEQSNDREVQGRGRHVCCSRAPLIPPRKLAHAFKTFGNGAKALCLPRFESLTLGLCWRNHLVPEERRDPLSSCFFKGQTSKEDFGACFGARGSEAGKAWRNRLRSTGNGGCQGSLRPLFRAIKKQEQVLVRPFRDFALEVRVHQRRAFWHALWCPPRQDLVQLQGP